MAGGQGDCDSQRARLGLTYRIGIHGVRSPHRKTEVRCTDALHRRATGCKPNASSARPPNGVSGRREPVQSCAVRATVASCEASLLQRFYCEDPGRRDCCSQGFWRKPRCRRSSWRRIRRSSPPMLPYLHGRPRVTTLDGSSCRSRSMGNNRFASSSTLAPITRPSHHGPYRPWG